MYLYLLVSFHPYQVLDEGKTLEVCGYIGISLLVIFVKEKYKFDLWKGVEIITRWQL